MLLIEGRYRHCNCIVLLPEPECEERGGERGGRASDGSVLEESKVDPHSKLEVFVKQPHSARRQRWTMDVNEISCDMKTSKTKTTPAAAVALCEIDGEKYGEKRGEKKTHNYERKDETKKTGIH